MKETDNWAGSNICTVKFVGKLEQPLASVREIIYVPWANWFWLIGAPVIGEVP